MSTPIHANVPTTDQMREDYMLRNHPRPRTETGDEFDRWLDSVRAEAFDDGIAFWQGETETGH